MLLAAGVITTGLSGCSKPFDHTVFSNEHYGPWKSSPGSENVPCYGREAQLAQTDDDECGAQTEIARAFKKNPRAALTPYAMEQIRWYAANAQQDTSATWQAGGLIYRLSFDTPRPSAIAATKICREVGVKVKTSGSDAPWQDLGGEYCF